MPERVAIIGGGLAGLAAAMALAERGRSVVILESRNRLGGRAGSFTDTTTGQVIDACQHVSMGCCTNLAHFYATLGIGHLLAPQPELFFVTPDGTTSRFAADRLPAPFHLSRSFARLHFLTLFEKARIAFGLACLRVQNPDKDPPFLPWLLRHGQTQRTIDRFWSLVLVSALNESVEKIGLKYARKVFVDGFMTHPRGFEVQVPAVPLDRLYGDELRNWFASHLVELRLNSAVKEIEIVGGRVNRLIMRTGEPIEADRYVAALPADRLLDVLSGKLTEDEPVFRRLRELEVSPIVSVHFWFDRPVMELPHAVLVDALGQWVFSRGEVAPGEHYVQIVVSAAHELRGAGHDLITARILAELQALFRVAKEAKLLRSRVVTEHAATFSAVPGVDRLRPGPQSPFVNLFLAGDWTATGWPATMEGAVRSGYRAVEVITGESIVRADLR